MVNDRLEVMTIDFTTVLEGQWIPRDTYLNSNNIGRLRGPVTQQKTVLLSDF